MKAKAKRGAARPEAATGEAPPVIEMRGVCKSYGKGQNRFQALTDVTLTVRRGDYIAVLGPSGSGKTTLMNIIGLMDTADEGEYRLDGVDVRRARDQELSRMRNRKIGFVFQKYNVIPKYSALYNVALPMLLQGASWRQARKRAKETLARVGLGDRAKSKPSELSGGQLQRVAIARALIGDKSLILADEPTGALDRKTGMDVLDFMAELNREGRTIVMITHDAAVAARAASIVRVEDGRLYIGESPAPQGGEAGATAGAADAGAEDAGTEDAGAADAGAGSGAEAGEPEGAPAEGPAEGLAAGPADAAAGADADAPAFEPAAAAYAAALEAGAPEGAYDVPYGGPSSVPPYGDAGFGAGWREVRARGGGAAASAAPTRLPPPNHPPIQ